MKRASIYLAVVLAFAGAMAAFEPAARSGTPDGRAMFVARCGSCHGERGDKPLSSGPPLSERALTSEKIAETVKSRMPRASDDERRAVAAYIASIVKKP